MAKKIFEQIKKKKKKVFSISLEIIGPGKKLINRVGAPLEKGRLKEGLFFGGHDTE
jgi:hypothetical protein